MAAGLATSVAACIVPMHAASPSRATTALEADFCKTDESNERTVLFVKVSTASAAKMAVVHVV
jgi:hypothetical protein